MTRIGFIGVGTMGLPMAKNLVKKGFTVSAFDMNPAAVQAAVAAGMTGTASAAEVVATADVVVTMLPSSPNVESAYTGDGGVLAAARKGTLCVDMSTIDPGVSRRVAAAAVERGLRFVDAPVSGGVPRAIDGTLAIMVGGSEADFAAARPVLEAMGANIFHVGPVGSGEVVKLCNNLIAGVSAVAVSEAFRLAEAFGVDPRTATDVIAKSSGNTWVMEAAHPVPGLVPRAASSQGYAPGFMTDLMCKDVGLAVDAARAHRIPIFVAPAAQQVYRLASSHGLGPPGLHERLHVPEAVVRPGPRVEEATPPRGPPPRRAAGCGRIGAVLRSVWAQAAATLAQPASGEFGRRVRAGAARAPAPW